MVTRIAAHIADMAKGIKGARARDSRMSRARQARDWEAMRKLALDPERLAALLEGEEQGDQCSMCGQYCALKVFDDAVGRGQATPPSAGPEPMPSGPTIGRP